MSAVCQPQVQPGFDRLQFPGDVKVWLKAAQQSLFHYGLSLIAHGDRSVGGSKWRWRLIASRGGSRWRWSMMYADQQPMCLILS